MESSQDISWRGGISLVLLLLLIGAAIKFCGMAIILSYDLKKSESAVAYWKGIATGQPVTMTEQDAACGPAMFR